MVDRATLVEYLDQELDIDHYNEAGDKYNGVLVTGGEDVKTVGLCTNCTFETIENAAGAGCDLVISHHGGWEAFDGDLLSEKKEQIAERGMTWFIAHHALDCADGYGVAVALAEQLGVSIDGRYGDIAGGDGGRYGALTVDADEFRERIYDISEEPTIIGDLDTVEDAKIGVIGGGGGAFRELLDETVAEGCDVLVTGSSAFYTEIHAHELGLVLVALGETASERWGVYRLGEHLKERFGELETIRLEERDW